MTTIEFFNSHFFNYMNQLLQNSFKISGLTILIMITVFSVATAQSEIKDVSKKTMNLEQAIQISLANNTQMKRSLLSIKNADQDIRKAWSNVMPSVTTSANYTRNLEVPVNFIPAIIFDPNANSGDLVPVAFGTDNSWQGGLSVSQTIFSGQAFVGISSSELYKEAQSESMRATSQGIVTKTRIAYYQALVSKEQLRLVQTQIDRIKQNLKDTKIRYEQGFTDEYAVLQLEVQLGNLEPQLIQAEFQVKKALQELLDVMGLPVQLSIDIKGDLGAFNVRTMSAENEVNIELKKVDRLTTLTLEEDSIALNNAMNFRGDLRMLDIQKELLGKQLDAEKSTYLPTISASYNLNWSASQPGKPVFFGTDDSRARSQTLMLNVQVPIFQGFKRDAAVQQAQIQVKDNEVQLFQAAQTASKEILSAKQDVSEALQTNEALKKAIDQAEIGYERATIRYQNGLGSQQEVTDADLQLRQAEVNYTQMVARYLTAKAQYDLAVGKVPFIEEDIQEIKKNIELK